MFGVDPTWQDGPVTPPPRRRGLGLGGRQQVQLRQAELHWTIAEEAVFTADRAAAPPAQLALLAVDEFEPGDDACVATQIAD
jgi:hypothetical protein